MSTEERSVQRYMPGDEIGMRIEVAHRMNLEMVNIVFVHEGDTEMKIILTGAPEPEAERPSFGRQTWSKAEVWGVVEEDHTPGFYVLDEINVSTAGENSFRLSGRDEKVLSALHSSTSLEVVQEPRQPPQVLSGGFID